MKFLVTFEIFADSFFYFCKELLLIKVLLKLRQKSVRKVLLQFAILIEFVIFAIFAIFSIHFLTVRLIFLPKLRKQFATKFLRQCPILETRGEPQDIALHNSFNHFNEKKKK